MNVLRAQVIRNSIKVNLLKYITFNEYILSFHVIKKKKISMIAFVSPQKHC